MKQFKLLVSLSLKEYLSFFSRKKISTGKKILVVFLPIIFIALAILSTLSTAATFIPPLAETGRLYLLSPIMMLLTFIVICIIVARRIKPMVFLASDINFLKTLPIKPFSIILSKLFVFYLLMVLLTFVIMIGTDILLLIILGSNNISLLILNILFSFLIPIVPIVFMCLLILPFSILPKYFKVSNIFRVIDIIMTIVLFTSLIVLLTLAPLMNERHVDILDDVITSFFLTYWYKVALDLSIIYIMIFIVINIILLIIFLMLMNKYYFKLHNVLSKKDKKRDYKTKYLRNNNIEKVLFSKELKLYKKANGYIINTIIFPIMIFLGVITLGVLRFMGELDILFESEFQYLAIFAIVPVIIWFNAFTATTTFSLSLEGENFYLLKVLPISHKKIIDAKVRLHVLMLGVLPAISAIIIALLLNAAIMISISMGILVLIHSYFMAYFGMIINLYFPKINFKSEISVIKNSTATFAMLLFSQLILLPIMIPVVMLVLNSRYNLSIIILAAYIIIITIMSKAFLAKKTEELFNKIK